LSQITDCSCLAAEDTVDNAYVQEHAFFLVVSLTFAMNARLYPTAPANIAYSAADYDPWYVDFI